jgi:hypothetical protein
MEPAFGWTLLSADAIRRAEARLREDAQGVRDEIGFMYLHQAYADRFFPGTSVQHTRLRYALFVPWTYQKIAAFDLRKRRESSIEKLVIDEEVRLTGRLLNSGESDGVIGRRVYPQRRASSQPATMVYWSALAAWGLLRRLDDGSVPSRAAVHRAMSSISQHIRVHDDDGVPIEEIHSVFATLPPSPPEWSNQGPITFKLREAERSFMRRQMLTTRKASNEPSLLARLAEEPGRVTPATTLWSKGLVAIADSGDRAALERARSSAALAAIGRGVYAALVEEMRDQRDRVPTSMFHRSKLPEIVARYRDKALELDIATLPQDAPGLPGSFLAVLAKTQSWLESDKTPYGLLDPYLIAERKRKGNRARLVSSPLGRQKRAEWDNENHPLATPLHYRWSIVRRMLLDLEDYA